LVLFAFAAEIYSVRNTAKTDTKNMFAIHATGFGSGAIYAMAICTLKVLTDWTLRSGTKTLLP
jgi:hypothetical protein